MEVNAIPQDVCSKNHGGNGMSRAANPTRSTKAGDLERILAFMDRQPHTETWVKQIIAELGLPHQTASARLSDLKAMKRIEVVPGKKVDGCGVVRLAKVFEGGLF